MEFKDLLYLLSFLFTIEVSKGKFYQKYGFCQGALCSYPAHRLMISHVSLNIFGESSS